MTSSLDRGMSPSSLAMAPGVTLAYSKPTSRSLASRLLRKASRFIKFVRFVLREGGRYRVSLPHPALVTALGEKRRRSHISDHLVTLFYCAIDAAPRLIVELGTGPGESTRVFLAAASITDSRLLSVDIADRSHLDLPFRERWHFVQADDVAFGRDGFTRWCQEQALAPRIDLLFIDTSHFYDHTREEIATWSAHLSERAVLIFHDTNMGDGFYARFDGSFGFGYENRRGVMRAIEDLVGRSYDERTFFSDLAGGFLITHNPSCNGLAILKRVPPPAGSDGSFRVS